MSSYSITPLNPQHKAMVGYDNPRRTLFAMVFKKTKAFEPPLLWVGANYDEIQSIDFLQERIAPYAPLDDSMRAQIQADIESGVYYIPSALQVRTERIIRGV